MYFDTTDGQYKFDAFETGRVNTDLYSLAYQSTNYGLPHHTYQDWVAALFLGNQTQSRFGDTAESSHNNWGYGLSYEAGRHLKTRKNWRLEGQMQFAYSSMFNKAYTFRGWNVDPGDSRSLVGRLGLRYYRINEAKKDSNAPYIIVNVLHEFLPATTMTFGKGTFTPNFSRTWGTIGVGGQHYFNSWSYLYGDVRYEHSLGGEPTSHGLRGTIGYHRMY